LFGGLLEGGGHSPSFATGGPKGDNFAGAQLAMKTGLRAYDRKRHLSPADFFWGKAEADHDGKHGHR